MNLLSNPVKRRAAWFLILTLVAQLFAPYYAMALTGGPSQPEVQSFEPIGTSEMVDVSSGSFTYNIPLIEVGGYPINLAYHSGAGMDDEASCMGGLGWNINVGALNRNMRGLPDDFDGDEIERRLNMKDNVTWGGKLGVAFEIFGKKAGSNFKGKLGLSLGGFWNSYKGVGLEFGVSPTFSAGVGSSSSLTLGLGFNASSASGVSFSPQLGLNFEKQVKGANLGEQGYLTGGFSLGTGFNSRQGLRSFTVGASMGISGKDIQEVTNPKGEVKNVDKADGNSRSLYGGSATYDFVAPTYSPGGEFSYKNQSVNLAFTIGGELWGIHPSATITGYFSKQSLEDKYKKSAAFGYLYAQNAKKRLDAVQDFNREKDMTFTENTPNLPMPIHTNDIYSATGQGIGGSYQLKRGDVGVVSDQRTYSYGEGNSIGGELGLGNTAHGGVDLGANFSESYTSAWVDNNYACQNLAYQDKGTDSDFESAYFKMAGEKSVDADAAYWNTIGGTKAVQVALDGGKPAQKNVQAKDNWLGGTKFPPIVKRNERDKRNQPVSYLTAWQAKDFALEKVITSFKENVYGQYIPPTPDKIIPRSDATVRKKNHLSEITVQRQDGLRYLYGLPAYNNRQVEAGFSVSGSGDCTTGIANYTAAENSTDNKSGRENYYSKTTLPPYVHSWMLTAVLSADYVDVTGDGPTPDDLGTYTYFRYTRIHQNYRWRVPYDAMTANFNEGFKTDPGDDKANYLYGEKEIWLLQSVESKTQVAEFYYGSRADGLGVASEDGGKDLSQSLRKLEKIVLFSLPDRRNNGVGAEPLKTVHFDYNYELLPGIPNSSLSGGGKLTLKALSFTFGKSQKGKLSPYRFFYDNKSGGDYAYNIKAYNRWGTFQPNKATSCDPASNSILSNADFPYVDQSDRAQQDAYATWQNLKEIQVPSGGVIKIEYEANDYAFVQNSRAMEMVKLVGFASSATGTPVDELYNGPTPNDYLFFDLPKQLQFPSNTNTSILRDEIGRRFLSDSPEGGRNISPGGFLYFKCLINLGEPGAGKYEYVPGYAQVDDYGAIQTTTNGSYDRVYIKLRKVCIKDKESRCSIGNQDYVHPFAKAGWQYARLNLPRIAYGEPDPTASGGKQIAQALGALVMQYGQFFGSFNNRMHAKDFAKEVISKKSWIRLFSPTGKKVGGGVRVKSIRISDEWQSMAGAPHANAEYGQEYSYTTVERGDTISSGVATYEPLVGGEENPFRQPIFYNEAYILAPDNNLFQEHPYGESYFPAAQVVYAEVQVRNLSRKDVERHATGHTVYKYYTSRDFPTKYSSTGVQAKPKRTRPIFQLFKIKNKDYMNASQGFVVETNDMAGQPESRWIYDESGAAISGIEYHYKTDAQGLNNEAQVILPDGKLARRNIGLECSLINDSREAFSSTTSPGVQLNFDGFLTGIFPTLAVIPWPSWQSEETRFRSMVTTKVVHRYGLLESTTAYDLGSKVSTENLAWDAETGQVILTRTWNEHDDPIYNVNFPAHWAYQGMQAAFKNLGVTFSGAISNGVLQKPGVAKYFVPGDEVAITKPPYFAKRGWVKDILLSANQIYIVDAAGQPIHTGTTVCNIEVIRSGRRNQQLSSIGAVTCLQMPFDANGKLDFQNKQILNASAVEYDDQWQTWCGTKSLASTCSCQAEPVASELLNLLAGLVSSSNNQIVLIPKTSPLNISSLTTLLPYIDATCGNVYTGTNNYFFASELQGNDLVCYFGKTAFEKPDCWYPCLTIPNFGILLDAQNVKVFRIYDLQPDLSACNGSVFCFKASVETLVSQWGVPYPAFQNEDFRFCGTACFDVFKCSTHQQLAQCGWQTPGDVVNPYRLNIRGNYRPKRAWSYLTDRVQNPVLAKALTNTRSDGYFAQFATFWEPRSASPWVARPTGWVWSSEVTRYNPTGNEVENRDAIDRYSAELNGYANTQVTAVANNARYRQIAFEGFEDYNFDTYACSRHFEFPISIADTTSQTSHTGKYSVQVQPSNTLVAKYPIRLPTCPPTNVPTQKNPVPYKLHECDCIGKFSPDPGNYVVWAWIKEDQPLGTLNYSTAQVEINTGGQSFKFKPTGQIIEGWQRIYGEFKVPVGAPDIEIVLNANGVKTWFDDLRIAPFDAGIRSFVYDEHSLRFTFELDENNYFTRYEYDAEGQLELVKKETEQGVMTVKESRFSRKKQ